MEKVKVTTELIKEVHNQVNTDLKRRIEKELPDLFNKFEVGKWYKYTSFGKLMGIFNGEYGNGITYGFNYYGDFTEKIGFHREDKFTLATEEEVKTALINEAVNRGFVDGAKTSCLTSLGGVICGKPYFEDWQLKVKTYGNNSGYADIFDNGKWATLITEPIEKELLIERANKVEAELIELKKQINELKN